MSSQISILQKQIQMSNNKNSINKDTIIMYFAIIFDKVVKYNIFSPLSLIQSKNCREIKNSKDMYNNIPIQLGR